jgi:hypothetical protein
MKRVFECGFDRVTLIGRRPIGRLLSFRVFMDGVGYRPPLPPAPNCWRTKLLRRPNFAL